MNHVRQSNIWIVAVAGLFHLTWATTLAHADTFARNDNCPSEDWYACCQRPDGEFYNNWLDSPVGGCPAPPLTYPQLGDSAYISTHSVYLDNTTGVTNLFTDGPFQMRKSPDGGLPGLLVDGAGVFSSEFYFDAGTLTGGLITIEFLLEFRTSDEKYLGGGTLIINPFAIARVSGDGNLGMNSATLSISSGGKFEFLGDASINPGQLASAVINAGHFLKDGSGGVSRVGVPLYNDGVVEVRTGTLRLESEAGTSTGAFIMNSGGVLEIAAHTFAEGVSVVSDGTDGFVRVAESGGRLDLLAGAAPSIPNLWMAPESAVRGSGDLDVTTSFLWFGGFFETAGTVTLSGATGITGSAGKGTTSSLVVNTGAVTWIDGEIGLGLGTLDNHGLFDAFTDADITGGTFNNLGTFTKADSSGETVVGVFNNIGQVYARSGRLSFGVYTQTDGETVLEGGDIGSGEPLRFLGGALTGSGTVFGTLEIDGGEVAPGLSPGTVTVTGNYMQTAAGTLDIQIGGPLPGSDYDQLIAPGIAILDGTMNVSLIDDFVPDPGDEFEVLTYGSHIGQFATVNLPSAPNRRFGLTVEPTRAVFRAAEKGDWDIDGDIDVSDYAVFSDCMAGPGTAPSPTPPTTPSDCLEVFDFDTDADVDLRDADSFAQSFTG